MLKKIITVTALSLFSATLFAQPASAMVEFDRDSPFPQYIYDAYEIPSRQYSLLPCAAKGEGPIYWTASTAPSDLKYKDAFVADLEKAYSHISEITGGRFVFEYVDTTDMRGVLTNNGLDGSRPDRNRTPVASPRYWENNKIAHTVVLSRTSFGSVASPGSVSNVHAPEAHIDPDGMFRRDSDGKTWAAGNTLGPAAGLWPSYPQYRDWEASGYQSVGSVSAASIPFSFWQRQRSMNPDAALFYQAAARLSIIFPSQLRSGVPVVTDLDYYTMNFIADESCNYDWKVQAKRGTPPDQLGFAVNNLYRQRFPDRANEIGLSTAANPPAGWNGPPKAPAIKGLTTLSTKSVTEKKVSKKSKCKKFKKAGKKKKYRKCLSTIQ